MEELHVGASSCHCLVMYLNNVHVVILGFCSSYSGLRGDWMLHAPDQILELVNKSLLVAVYNIQKLIPA